MHLSLDTSSSENEAQNYLHIACKLGDGSGPDKYPDNPAREVIFRMRQVLPARIVNPIEQYLMPLIQKLDK